MANLRDTFALREALDKINSQIKYKPYDDVVQPSVRALDGDGTTVYRAIQMVIRVRSASVCLPYNGYRKPYNTVTVRSPSQSAISQLLLSRILILCDISFCPGI